MDFLMNLQRWIYGGITGQLSGYAGARDLLGVIAILPLGIMFGAVYAFTPGHGKTILASYLVGSRLPMLRRLGVAGVLAFTHVASAVLLALLATPLVTRTLGGVGRAPSLEFVSRGLLVVIGLWLLVRALRVSEGHSKQEGLFVGVVAGLVPCPLTLFVMFFALTRGVPEAGIAFAAAMVVGVGVTLAAVAVLAILGRQWLVGLLLRHGESLSRLAQGLDAASGTLLVVIGIGAFLR